jgi:diguanylate cyclase (GGDEF)-like protein
MEKSRPTPDLEDADGRFLTRVALPAFGIVCVLALILAALTTLSARQANNVAMERQRDVAAAVLQQSTGGIAHDQEGATVWDEAVRRVTAPKPDLDWLDENLGVWLHTYNGHDEAFILDGADRPIYAMRDGARKDVSIFGRHVAKAATPLVRKLRHKLRHPRPGDVNRSTLTPGEVDLGMVHGHPSIISVKPIVSDTGLLRQGPDRTALHIAVRYLDGSFLHALSRQYKLDRVRFSPVGTASDEEAVIPMKSASGNTLGYLVWTPFRPGMLLLEQLVPTSVAAVLLILAMVGWLLRRIWRSMLELRASRAQAQHLAFHDALTGLANRSLFEDRLMRALAAGERPGGEAALLYIDLDRFKSVNDTLGHQAGDALIVQVARRLMQMTRSSDTVARLGGDEFAIIQCGVTTASEVEVLCMRIVEAIHEPFELGGTRVTVSASIGIAMAPVDAGDRTELARKADIALYEAKARGRGQYVFFAAGMDESIKRRQIIEAGLERALRAGDQFEVYYQPLYSARTSAITGAEALVRWHHPQFGLTSPATFIPIAEESGLIEPLGEWILAKACSTARDWPIDAISVNVSAVQIRNASFAERVMAILTEVGFDPRRLELEITETSFMECGGHSRANLDALRAQSIRIALDDFGTGYSSFNHLQQFEVDRIKIDQSFVSGIGTEATGSPIIRAILDLAKASGMQVTAEGVETAEQSRFLSDAGCNTLQGYHLGRPVPAAEMRRLMSAASHRLPAA